jgi:NAD+ kinase
MIAICPNPFRDKNCELSRRVSRFLNENGFETCYCPIFADQEDETLPKDLQYRRLTDVASTCSLLVVIGGDGTILYAARQIHPHSVPMLGINLGTKGFMANLEPEEYEYVLQAARGEYKLSRRMKLDVSLYRGNKEVCRDQALNDVVMHGYGDCIKITALCNGNRITAFSGDGIILSTPTGSTGYSMSAGGPIVEPDAENVIISPICAHMMSSRSFVLSPDNVITVEMEKQHERRAYLSVDGYSVSDLCGGDRIIVRRSESYTHMADLGLRNFYDIAFEKLR